MEEHDERADGPVEVKAEGAGPKLQTMEPELVTFDACKRPLVKSIVEKTVERGDKLFCIFEGEEYKLDTGEDTLGLPWGSETGEMIIVRLADGYMTEMKQVKNCPIVEVFAPKTLLAPKDLKHYKD